MKLKSETMTIHLFTIPFEKKKSHTKILSAKRLTSDLKCVLFVI